MAVLDKFVVALGFDFDDRELKKFSQTIDDVEKLAVGFAATIVAASTALFGFASATTAATDEQGKMADQIGIGVDELDAWQHAATLAGDSSSSAASAINQFSIRASEAVRGIGTGVEAFGLLGVSITDANGELKETPALLLDVAGEMQGLGRAQQIELAEKLGLSGAIRLLQQGPEAIQELIADAKALGTITAEDAAISADFQDELSRVWRIVKQVSRVLTRELAPVIERMNQAFVDWWKANRQLIEQRLPDWISSLSKAFRLLFAAASLFAGLKLGIALFQFVGLFTSLAGAATLASAATLLVPVAILAVVAALGLLAEDSKTFFDGGDSLIGRLIDRFPEWRNEIELVGAAFATLFDLGKMVFDGWLALFDLVANNSFSSIIEDLTLIAKDLLPTWVKESELVAFAMQGLHQIGSAAFQGLSILGEGLLDLGKLILDGWVELFDLITNNPLSELIGDVGGLVGDIGSTIGSGLSDALGNLRETLGIPAGGAAVRPDAQPGELVSFQHSGLAAIAGLSLPQQNVQGAINSSSKSQNITVNGGAMTINIDGASDPASIVDEIEARNSEALRQAALNVNTSVVF